MFKTIKYIFILKFLTKYYVYAVYAMEKILKISFVKF